MSSSLRCWPPLPSSGCSSWWRPLSACCQATSSGRCAGELCPLCFAITCGEPLGGTGCTALQSLDTAGQACSAVGASRVLHHVSRPVHSHKPHDPLPSASDRRQALPFLQPCLLCDRMLGEHDLVLLASTCSSRLKFISCLSSKAGPAGTDQCRCTCTSLPQTCASLSPATRMLVRCCCRHLRPDDKHIVAEIEAMVTSGTLARVKSMHPNAGPLSPKLMRPSVGLNVCCNTGEAGVLAE